MRVERVRCMKSGVALRKKEAKTLLVITMPSNRNAPLVVASLVDW